MMLDNNLVADDIGDPTPNVLYSWNGTIPTGDSGIRRIELVAYPFRGTTQQVVFDNATITTEVITE